MTDTDTTQCICCDGKGYQVRNDGIKVPCPGCTTHGRFMLDDFAVAPGYPVPVRIRERQSPTPWLPDIYADSHSGCPCTD